MKRSQRKLEKLKKNFDRRRELYHLMKQYGNDIMQSDSLAINRKLGIHCQEKDLVRGALLHDYFLYDWHDKNRENYQFFHGFYHPGIALKNAKKEYKLTPREQDIIKKHMWPLTIVPPFCREAWVVSMADKYCSILETLRIRKGTADRKVHLKKKDEGSGVKKAC